MILRTPRLILRDFVPSDLSAYCALREHPDFQRLRTERDVSTERSAELLHEFVGWAVESPRSRYQLAIEKPEDGLIGSCGVRITAADHAEASFGCELGQEHWGKGYAFEASRALIAFAFAELGLHRIHAETLANNQAALSLARRLGMRVEGRHKETRWIRGKWWDTVTLAMLDSEGESEG
ncbi:MAG: GNAT family N-acetyltransferase [Gemmatimonadota bacterium]